MAPMNLDPSSSSLFRRGRDIPPGAWAAAAVGAAVAASYAVPLQRLFEIWWHEPSYSHGFLVLPIAGLILWLRRDRLGSVAIRPNVLGWVALAAILAVRWVLYERNELWMEQATIPLVAASLVLAFGGPGLLWWTTPGLLFSLLMLPLPPRINLILAAPLQTIATIASAGILALTGLPVLSEGHIIFVGTEPLEVARACNGLSMLLSFVTLITAVVLLARDRPTWERIVLLLSTIPIALISNILRIVVTAWCYYAFGPKSVVNYGFGKTTVGDLGHDAAGWGMMPIALGLVLLELKVLAWLIVPDIVNDRAMVFLPQKASGPPALGGGKGKGTGTKKPSTDGPGQLGGPTDLA
jgi:exosortase